MEHRKRVEMIMNSQVFREELERIVESQLQDGYMPASLSALQQVTELLLPNSARNSQMSRLGHSGMPINDIRGVDAFRYAKGEKLLRCKLASVYRLVDLYGWSQGIYNHITVSDPIRQPNSLIIDLCFASYRFESVRIKNIFSSTPSDCCTTKSPPHPFSKWTCRATPLTLGRQTSPLTVLAMCCIQRFTRHGPI